MTKNIAGQRYAPISIFLHWAMFAADNSRSCILLRENFTRGTDMRQSLKARHFMLGLNFVASHHPDYYQISHRKAVDHAETTSLADVPVEGCALGALCFHDSHAATGLDHPECRREIDPVLWAGTVSAREPEQSLGGAGAGSARNHRHHRHHWLFPDRFTRCGGVGASLLFQGQYSEAYASAQTQNLMAGPQGL